MPCPYEMSLRFRDCSLLTWRPASEGGPYNSHEESGFSVFP